MKQYLLVLFVFSLSLSVCFSQTNLIYDGNNDGCVDLNDLLGLISEYTQCTFQCGDNVMFAGYSYSTVSIGQQCWFSENCRYLPSVSPSSSTSETLPYYYVYGYEGNSVTEAHATSNYLQYGALYNFDAIMLGNVCPYGWHIPTDLEWSQLTNFLGGETVAGAVMKSDYGWSNNGNGSNVSGFSALPSGYLNINGAFSHIGNFTYWWSSTSTSATSAWNRNMLSFSDHVYRLSFSQSHGYSARCIRD